MREVGLVLVWPVESMFNFSWILNFEFLVSLGVLAARWRAKTSEHLPWAGSGLQGFRDHQIFSPTDHWSDEKRKQFSIKTEWFADAVTRLRSKILFEARSQCMQGTLVSGSVHFSLISARCLRHGQPGHWSAVPRYPCLQRALCGVWVCIGI